jgi:hypothetical protein
MLVAIYTVGVLSGWIPAERRLDAVHLAILVAAVLCVAFLLRPGALDRISLVEMQGFKFQLSAMQQQQVKQKRDLEFIRLVLPLLLPESERNHLLSLKTGQTYPKKGSHDLRTELRHLRSIGLLEMVAGHVVGEAKDGIDVDIAKVVSLTPNGKAWVDVITESEKPAQETIDG